MTRQRAKRLASNARAVNQALAEAAVLQGQAQAAPVGDLSKWAEALAAAKRARDLITQGEADAHLQEHISIALSSLEAAHDAARKRADEADRDRKFLERLDGIRGTQAEHWDPKQSDADYARAFRDYGLDFDALDPKEAGADRQADEFGGTHSRHRRLGLDSAIRAGRERQGAMATFARGGERGRSGRMAQDFARANRPERLGRPPRLGRQRTSPLGTESVEPDYTGEKTLKRGDRRLGENVLIHAWRQNPGDFWVNYQLSFFNWDRSIGLFDHPEAAARYISTAVSLRPLSFTAHNGLGLALLDQKQFEESMVEFRTALKLKPGYVPAHNNLGIALYHLNKFDDAIAEYRTALKLKPDYPPAHLNLGRALAHQNKYDEAIAEYRIALKLKPDYLPAHTNLGLALERRNKSDEALAEYHAALKLNSKYARSRRYRPLAGPSEQVRRGDRRIPHGDRIQAG